MLEAKCAAKYIIKYCNLDKGYCINNYKLQFLLYFSQAASLVKYDRPLFYDVIEAWRFGPCIPNIYYHYCGFAGAAIYWLPEIHTIDFPIEEEDRKLIEYVCDIINTMPIYQMHRIVSHQRPYAYALKVCPKSIITLKSMEDYFCPTEV